MYQLWAKKRPIQGVGSPYEFIISFEREEEKYYFTDQLDRNIYQECMVVKDNQCIFYREFDLPYVYKLYKTGDYYGNGKSN